MYGACINWMKYFHVYVNENISSQLYMHHMHDICVQTYEPMFKKKFHKASVTKFWDGKFVMMTMLTYDSCNSNSLSFNKFTRRVIEQNKVGRYAIGG
jgi:hypothetical protein